jgi:hypothetical protein
MSTDEPIATPAPAPDPAPAATVPAAEIPIATDHRHDVAQIFGFDSRVSATVSELVRQIVLDEKVMVEIEAAVARELDARIADLKADILAHLTPMITAVTTMAPAAAPAAVTRPIAPTTTLKAEDPVKVWQDAEHQTFLEGRVVAVHDGAYAFDVKLSDGTVTKVGADGLEYDDHR